MKSLASFLGGSAKTSFSLLLIHSNLIIYSMAFWIQNPVLPQKLKNLNASEVEVGSLQSIGAILALLGSTVVGRIVDVYGAKTGLLLSQMSSAVMYFIISQASTMNDMYIATVPSFFQHAMLCASASVALLTTTDQRHLALGRLGLSYGVGMSIGSPLGGAISKHFSPEVSFQVATLACVIMITIDLLFLPPLLAEKTEEVDGQSKESSEKNKFE